MVLPAFPNAISATQIRNEFFDSNSVGLGEFRGRTIHKPGSSPSFNNITSLPTGQISYSNFHSVRSTYNIEVLLVGGGAGGGGGSANGGGGGGGAGSVRYIGSLLVVNDYGYGIAVGGGGGGSGTNSQGGYGAGSAINYYYGDNTNANSPSGGAFQTYYEGLSGGGGGSTDIGVTNGNSSTCGSGFYYNCGAGSGGGAAANANRQGSPGSGTTGGGAGFRDSVRGSGGGGGGAGGAGQNAPSRGSGGNGGFGIDINFFSGGDLSADVYGSINDTLLPINDPATISRYRFVAGGGGGGWSNNAGGRGTASSGGGNGWASSCNRRNAKNEATNYICGFDSDNWVNGVLASGGGGGGGAGSNVGGNGGSGMVIIRYANLGTDASPVYRGSGGYQFARSGYCFHLFTGSSTFTA